MILLTSLAAGFCAAGIAALCLGIFPNLDNIELVDKQSAARRNRVLGERLGRAGVRMSPVEFRHWSVIGAIATGGVVAVVSGTVLIPILIAAGVGTLPRLWLYRTALRRTFERKEKVPPFLEKLVAQLKSGAIARPHSALARVADDVNEEPLIREAFAAYGRLQRTYNDPIVTLRIMRSQTSDPILDELFDALALAETANSTDAIANLEHTIVFLRGELRIETKSRNAKLEIRATGWLMLALPIVLAISVAGSSDGMYRIYYAQNPTILAAAVVVIAVLGFATFRVMAKDHDSRPFEEPPRRLRIAEVAADE